MALVEWRGQAVAAEGECSVKKQAVVVVVGGGCRFMRMHMEMLM